MVTPNGKSDTIASSTRMLNIYKKIAAKLREEVRHEKELGSTHPVQVVWKNVFLMLYIHLAGLYALTLGIFGYVSWKTWTLSILNLLFGGLGVTAGAHRLWAHKCYNANLPLQILLAYLQTLAAQNSIYEWCRDHRVHHKFTETDADPHNARRGFFFAHVGWLLCRKHNDVKVKGGKVEMSDLEANSVVMFQKKYYILLTTLCCFIIPTFITWYFFEEDFITAWCFNLLRYTVLLNGTWTVNSAAHLWGSKPYDRTINPVENKTVAAFTLGEGWHNYHHVFPWDYKAAELGQYNRNITTAFIDFFALIGWAFNLKTVSKKIVMQRVARTGDGSYDNHTDFTAKGTTAPWGWGDEDILPEDAEVTEIRNRLEEVD